MPQMVAEEVESMHWPVLEPIEGDRERPVALSKPVCVAGDRSRVNLTLPSLEVSRAHALFVADDDGVYLRDLASRNRTYVNEEPVRETRLDNGDVIRIGPYTFRCQRGFPADGAGSPDVPAAELFVEGSDTAIPLRGRTAVIGTRRECDVRVTDEAVEPVHAVMFERHGAWHIRDLRGRTGTSVNDELVGQVELQLGDRIRVGNTTLRYTRPAEPTQPEMPEIPVASAADLSLADQPGQDDSAAPLDQVSLEPLDGQEPPQEQPSPAVEDSGVVPLAVEATELEAAQSPKAASEPASSSSFSSPEVVASPDDSLIPLADESAAAAPPASVPATPEPIAQSPDMSAIPVKDDTDERQPAKPAEPPIASASVESPHPGQESRIEPRAIVEENLDELLEELAENVGEIQTTWEQLKSTEEPPSGTSKPGAGRSADPSGRDRKTSDDRPSRRRPASPTSN